MSKLSKNYDDIKRKNIISIQINLLNECTSKCKYCRKYTWPKDILDPTLLKRAIYHLYQYHALKSITFSGGDPILYPYLIDILQYCQALGIATSLITTLITEDTSLLHDVAEYTTRLHVSVDGANKELYLKTRGVDKFETVKENIKFVNNIRKHFNKIPIRISSTISSINQNKLYELFEFAKTTDSTINYYFIHKYDQYNPDSAQIMKCLKSIYLLDDKNITNISAILAKNFTNDISTIKSNICNIPYIHCLINSNGDVYPCCKLLNDNGEYGEQIKYVYGNINTDDLFEVFSKSVNKSKNICTECNGCEERYIPFIDEVNEIMNDKGDITFL